MQIQNATGHLTARNRQVIAHMIGRGWATADTPKARYALSSDGDLHKVVIRTSEADDYGRMSERKRTVQFTVAP